MLLVIDVGNTHLTMGVFKEKNLIGTFRMTSKRSRTSDELGMMICSILEHRKVMPEDIKAVIISSVVPDIMHSLGSAVIKYFDLKPIVVSAGIKTGLRIDTENPKQIGADRIVDAVAAYELYGGPVIVVDFGTATTYDLVGPDCNFEAGVIAPGIETSARSLWNEATMLPAIEIAKPKSILAKETISSMQAGLVYGVVGQAEYIVDRIKQESKHDSIKVVATGGIGRIIAAEAKNIDEYDPNLTLEGLRLIYEKNKR
ncbi:MAG: type III pantothenate kinase [Hespellia sp.]|nr:type III pantothenate kinase [Hespellia sp.]